MWTTAQTSQAGKPENRRNRRSATAYVRPTIARSPLSQYQNGLSHSRSVSDCMANIRRENLNIDTYRLVCIFGYRMKATNTRTPENTRGKILQAAFNEFYKNGFQGG